MGRELFVLREAAVLLWRHCKCREILREYSCELCGMVRSSCLIEGE